MQNLVSTPWLALQRLGLLRALGVLDSAHGPGQFDAITKLLCAVFNVPIALVSLVDAGASGLSVWQAVVHSYCKRDRECRVPVHGNGWARAKRL